MKLLFEKIKQFFIALWAKIKKFFADLALKICTFFKANLGWWITLIVVFIAGIILGWRVF